MTDVRTSRLFLLCLAGAVAGLLVFAILNPGIHQEEMAAKSIEDALDRNPAHAYMSAMLLGASFAAMLGGLLVLADEIGSPAKRMALKMMLALIMGVCIGGMAGAIAQFLFAGSASSSLGLLGVVIGRSIGWAVVGGAAGASVGAAFWSSKRAMWAIFGGLAGGFVGGFLFDAVSIVAQNGDASRFIGFTLMGAATGLAVAFVEDVAKQSWVTVLSGPKEGRSFILTKSITTLGRDELVDIPLFGDPSVSKQHAKLVLQNGTVIVQSDGGLVSVNGAQVQSAELNDSDFFSLGRFSLRFHQKASVAAKRTLSQSTGQPQQRWFDPVMNAPARSDSQPQPTYVPVNQTLMAASAVTGNLSLVSVMGPHSGQEFAFGPGSIRIGREAGCAILLAQDTMISRNHAQITWDGAGWIIQDLGSTNGLYVNGARVTQHMLRVGDSIGVGQTVLQVNAV